MYFLLLLKLLLAPALVALATAASYRYGPKIAGVVAGFPVVAGPILLFFALEQGPAFAASAARSSVLGLVSLCGFCVVYTRMAKHHSWVVSVLCGWLSFGVLTLGLEQLKLPWWLDVIGVLVAVGLSLQLLPKPNAPLLPRVVRRWDVPARMFATAVLVTGLTTVAHGLGPRASGLLTPFPVVTSVIAVFAQREQGWQGSVRTLQGLLLSMPAFVAMFIVLHVALVTWGIAGAFAAGLTADAALLLLVLRWSR